MADWFEWDGNRTTVPEKGIAEFKTRNGRRFFADFQNLGLHHTRQGLYGSDVVAWRISKRKKQKQQLCPECGGSTEGPHRHDCPHAVEDPIAGSCTRCNTLASVLTDDGTDSVCQDCFQLAKDKFKTLIKSSLPIDPSRVIDQVSKNIDVPTIAATSRFWILSALKHLLRLGKKDDVNAELAKVENYIHRARTGEWIEDLQPKHYGGTLGNSDGDK